MNKEKEYDEAVKEINKNFRKHYPKVKKQKVNAVFWIEFKVLLESIFSDLELKEVKQSRKFELGEVLSELKARLKREFVLEEGK